MKKYTPKEVESKWQKVWADTGVYEVTEEPSREKIYATPMLPYPSGAGLHVGHVRNYSIADAVARFWRQRGYNVMSNIGWDAFGLPAENYAIKTGTPPAVSTAANIANFEVQLKRLGISYAWDRLVNTSNPSYYKWTQWIFTQLYNDDLAYQAENLQWWCTKCKTVLANEQVIDGKCWRHDGADDPLVEKRRTKQWFFRITKYADPLLDELENLDWPESILTQQRNWIGRSTGTEIDFETDNGKQIRVFSTRVDTIFGATFLVLAPEHELIDDVTSAKQKRVVRDYVKTSLKKTDIERMDEGKEKSGVFTGTYAINPMTKEKIPIWVSDFVLGGYGTGAIMAVPGHDKRDYEFAKKFDLEIKPVVAHVHNDEVRPIVEGKPIEDRVAAQTIIKHPEEDKYLILRLKGWDVETFSLPIGGVDGGEDIAEAAQREAVEETGFTEFGPFEPVSQAYFALFHHDFKSVNRRAFIHSFATTLKSLKQREPSAEEKSKHELEWVSLDELQSKVHGQGVYNIVTAFKDDESIYSGEGVLINSGTYDGMDTAEAREKITAELAKKKQGQEKINYRLRDWLISRQRYWGAPIPIIHCPDCGAVAVPEKDLPVQLPEVESFEPTGTAQSVLASVEEWVNTSCPNCGKAAKRETDTMDGYACSSWYMHRYTDPHNDKMAWDPDKLNYWFPVDYYFGGDHAVSHLLYFRFWNHYFVDKGLVKKAAKEPVKRLVFNGYINAEDGRKMSKSLGNVVDPLEVIDSGYGADSLRMFELFVGPYDQDVQWNSNGVPGTYRFLQRVWTLVQDCIASESATGKEDPEKTLMVRTAVHRTIKKVTEDIEKYRFNTAIAACMELVNELNKLKNELPFTDAKPVWEEALANLVQLIAPFAPHIAEELWTDLGMTESIHIGGWPLWDERLIRDEVLTIVVQVNGKVRANISVPVDSKEADVVEIAQADDNAKKFIEQGKIRKTVFVPNKLVNFVVN